MYDEIKPIKIHTNGWKSAPEIVGRRTMLEQQFKDEAESKGVKFVYGRMMDYLIQLGLEAHESKAKPVQASLPVQKSIKQVAIDAAADDFEIFWTAGMVKNNKKKAFSLFKSLAGKNGGSLIFARKLADDVRYRIDAGQMGFDSLHPTTYLNGERWNDALPIPKQAGISTPDYSGFLGGGNQGAIEHE